MVCKWLVDLSNLYYKLRYYNWIVPHLASHLTNHFAFHPETLASGRHPQDDILTFHFPTGAISSSSCEAMGGSDASNSIMKGVMYSFFLGEGSRPC